MVMLYFDLVEFFVLFVGCWLWLSDCCNVVEFCCGDYFGFVELLLDEVVCCCVVEYICMCLIGLICLFIYLCYGGYVFNLVSFYYCYVVDGCMLEIIVVEIINMLWKECYVYVLLLVEGCMCGMVVVWVFDKIFYVLFFMLMVCCYDWCFSILGDVLCVYMNVFDGDCCDFDVMLVLECWLLDGIGLVCVLWCYLLMMLQVVWVIYWQVLKFWFKCNFVYDYFKYYEN